MYYYYYYYYSYHIIIIIIIIIIIMIMMITIIIIIIIILLIIIHTDPDSLHGCRRDVSRASNSRAWRFQGLDFGQNNGLRFQGLEFSDLEIPGSRLLEVESKTLGATRNFTIRSIGSGGDGGAARDPASGPNHSLHSTAHQYFAFY